MKIPKKEDISVKLGGVGRGSYSELDEEEREGRVGGCEK